MWLMDVTSHWLISGTPSPSCPEEVDELSPVLAEQGFQGLVPRVPVVRSNPAPVADETIPLNLHQLGRRSVDQPASRLGLGHELKAQRRAADRPLLLLEHGHQRRLDLLVRIRAANPGPVQAEVGHRKPGQGGELNSQVSTEAFLTPDYDITFSTSAERWNRRRSADRCEDLCLIGDPADEIVFLGGKDYLPLFCRLTTTLSRRKKVFFNSADSPNLPPGFTPVRYRTTTRTNWHYECARSRCR